MDLLSKYLRRRVKERLDRMEDSISPTLLMATDWLNNWLYQYSGIIDAPLGCDDLDLKAFAIVTAQVLSRTEQVPDAVSLDILAKVAAIVSEMDCHKGMGDLPQRWMDKLWAEESSTPFWSHEATHWIYAAGVFKDSHKYREATRELMLHWNSPAMPVQLPIDGDIIFEMNRRRKNTLYSIVSILTRLIDDTQFIIKRCDGSDTSLFRAG
ncbi:hypothetical protein F5B22DRAFT_231051 [Xylaria bambusicola]|uniref:uncharacterized protein n=1 Tax=Xylaria bambusicola TaxID=326684 RepID=UPI00200802E6|nr:uncharacterized protein F5B22DRAFT_231051 [Xylaria bambusicola]KAI0514520.1 hypothetical protein F5B22DRAFT_231051 [Xylaria bambusicola]